MVGRQFRRTLTIWLAGGLVALAGVGAALLWDGSAANAGAGLTSEAVLHRATQDSTTGLTSTIAIAPPCPLTITLHPNQPKTISCSLDLDDASPRWGERVGSGIVSVTVGVTTPGATIVGFGLSSGSFQGFVSGTTGHVRCGAANTLESCDTVLVTVAVRGAVGVSLPNTSTVSVVAQYTPDNPNENLHTSPTTLTLATVITQ